MSLSPFARSVADEQARRLGGRVVFSRPNTPLAGGHAESGDWWIVPRHSGRRWKLSFRRWKLSFRRWLVPTIQRGTAAWCGRFLIVSAPPAVSQIFGRGEIGLELYRWREK